MNSVTLHTVTRNLTGEILLPASKSESNRALIMRALAKEQHRCSFPEKLFSNLSTANDTIVMQSCLKELWRSEWNVEDAGTACRFLTAFATITGRAVRITGSERMKERPVLLLTEALKEIGFEIQYLEKEGFIPLYINGKNFVQKQSRITIRADISSQYISALLMIAPLLPQGLEIVFSEGEVYSFPYIRMTLKMMEHFCISYETIPNGYKIPPQQYYMKLFEVESDWSAASYIYSFAALSEKASIFLPKLRKESLQGDSKIAELMEHWGVETRYTQKGVRIKKSKSKIPQDIRFDCKQCPDLAQTVIVVAAATGANVEFTGMESLRIKETDRISALQTELIKAGVSLYEKEKGVFGLSGTFKPIEVAVETYKDHRMAMAFAPLIMIQNTLTIHNPGVVKKSFPDFWEAIAGWGKTENI